MKRKAEEAAEPAVKKTKTEEPAAGEGISNLFVGNMSWNIDEDWLRREFEGFGEIIGCRIITDRETGRAKGYVDCSPRVHGNFLTCTASVMLNSPRLPMPPRHRLQCTIMSSTVAN